MVDLLTKSRNVLQASEHLSQADNQLEKTGELLQDMMQLAAQGTSAILTDELPQ